MIIKPLVGVSRIIRLRPNTLQLAAGLASLRQKLRPGADGKVNRTVAPSSEEGFGSGAIPL